MEVSPWVSHQDASRVTLTHLCCRLGASGYIILPLSLFTAALATTSADWIQQHTTSLERIVMTTGLGMVAVGLWSGISLKKLGLGKR